MRRPLTPKEKMLEGRPCDDRCRFWDTRRVCKADGCGEILRGKITKRFCSHRCQMRYHRGVKVEPQGEVETEPQEDGGHQESEGDLLALRDALERFFVRMRAEKRMKRVDALIHALQVENFERVISLLDRN